MANYHTLAKNIATYPGSLAIFRRFLPENVRNILYLQAEIVHLSELLDVNIEFDNEFGNEKSKRYQFDVAAMKGPHEDACDGEQWRLVLELRRLLKEYDEAILLLAKLFELGPASPADLSCLQDLLDSPLNRGKNFLTGFETLTYSKKSQADLTSLMGREGEKDILTKWIDRFVRTFYHKYIGRKIHDPVSVCEAGGERTEKTVLTYYSDATVTSVIDALSTILSSLLPTISALVLFVINDPLMRMIALIFCTLLFSTILTVIARAKRTECFAATAAFSAVLVVFLGTTNGSGTA
ncbi:hypothetical protein LTR84_009606 [Exophiala bonariae]|uniref:DUF6594 domain-containing protein n=1 Tax=Exophiala bonariae TaxID=1690606 RepID=A0AAV9NMI2_9EURO|nr:hypothetical protein LTR84_009606 [Exophiala bonariae]